MNNEQWQVLLRCAGMEKQEKVPVALIVDSPWIPGYMKISTLDYLTDIGIWWNAQRKIREDFPEVIFLPDYWVEFGMAAEPSGFGCKLNFYDNQPITIGHLIGSCDDIVDFLRLPQPNPKRDGLMPLAINYYKRVSRLAKDVGEEIKLVASRGPMNIGTHIMGVTEFLLALKLYPEETHKLLRKTTDLVKDWLEAQADAVGTCRGIFLLDDIIGFLSPEDYMEFAHPYFKEIYCAFQAPVKILHNDTDNPVSYCHLEDMGINIFNFTHKKTLAETRALVGERICLMGNVPPLDVLTGGVPAEVEESALSCLNNYGSMRGILLSAGGGASPGMPAENLDAMVLAAKKWSENK